MTTDEDSIKRKILTVGSALWSEQQFTADVVVTHPFTLVALIKQLANRVRCGGDPYRAAPEPMYVQLATPWGMVKVVADPAMCPGTFVLLDTRKRRNG